LKGLEVVVVEAMDSILSKQLDKEGSKILEQCVRDTGIDVRLGPQMILHCIHLLS
ncbi:NAD-binding protein, partial [Clostridioides difficile]